MQKQRNQVRQYLNEYQQNASSNTNTNILSQSCAPQIQGMGNGDGVNLNLNVQGYIPLTPTSTTAPNDVLQSNIVTNNGLSYGNRSISPGIPGDVHIMSPALSSGATSASEVSF